MSWKKRIWQYSEMTAWHKLGIGSVSLMMLIFVARVTSCGAQPPPTTVQTAEGPVDVPSVCADGSAVGATREKACPAGEEGKIYEVCSIKTGAPDWAEVSRSCKAPEEPQCASVTFAQVKPVFDGKCVGCHGQWAGDNYELVKKDWNKIRYRITSANAGDKMPPQIGLPAADIKLFLDWEAGGFIEKPEDCQASTGGVLRIQELNAAMIQLAQADIEQQNFAYLKKAAKTNEVLPKNYWAGFSQKTSQVRFGIMAHKINGGIDPDDFRKQMAGFNKALNSVSRDDEIALCSPIGPSQSICGISLEDFGWTAADWDLFVQADKLHLVDNTTSGRILRQLTGSNQPWLHGDNLSIISQQPQVYYQILGIPTDLRRYLATKGVDLEKKIRERDIVQAGTFESPIALGKHRNVMFFEGDDGFCSITFDPNKADENLQENPIINLFNPGKNAFDFNYVASEILCIRENGTLEGSLWAANGVRQDAAPNDVVRDTENPYEPSPTIITMESCQGCHGNNPNIAMLPFVDDVGVFYSRSNGNLDAATLDFVRETYGQTTKLSGTISAINKVHAAAMAKVGIQASDGNVFKLVTYPFKQNWSLKKLADFLLIDEDELRVGIDSSNELRSQIGALLNGQQITEGAIVRAIPVVVREMQLLED